MLERRVAVVGYGEMVALLRKDAETEDEVKCDSGCRALKEFQVHDTVTVETPRKLLEPSRFSRDATELRIRLRKYGRNRRRSFEIELGTTSNFSVSLTLVKWPAARPGPYLTSVGGCTPKLRGTLR